MPPKRPRPPAPPPPRVRPAPKPKAEPAPESTRGIAKAVRPAFTPGADEPLQLFAVTGPGLEPFVVQELEALGLEAKAITGGVTFTGRRADLYRANLWLRTANRVLARLGGVYAGSFSELRAKAARLPWEQFVRPGQPVAVRVTSHKSKLYHTDAVAERVAGAISDALGQESPLHKAGGADATDDDEVETGNAQLVIVRIVNDRATLSVDSSGALLHQRGYRLATAKAPLRETLAAGLLLASRWDRTSPLVDPFCGSGTIVIEAARLALNIAPGLARRFAFMDWPAFDAALWGLTHTAAQAARTAAPPPPIFGYDRDAGAIEAARANAERAGVTKAIHFAQQSLSDLPAQPERGWLVTNPPYGVRVGGAGDLRDLYAQFGQVLRAQCPGWQAGLLAADQQLARATGLRFDLGRSVKLSNGGLPVQFLQARVQADPPPEA